MSSVRRSFVLLLLLAVPAVAAAATPAVPIPNAWYHFLARTFIGAPTSPQAVVAEAHPAHPFLAPQGRNGMHGDSYASGTHPTPGPLGNRPQVVSAQFGPVVSPCPGSMTDSRGRVITVCVNALSIGLYLLDPNTLATLAYVALPPRPSLITGNTFADNSGGAYFHLLAGDRPIVATTDHLIRTYRIVEGTFGPRFELESVKSLLLDIPLEARVADAMPDYAGNLWFVTQEGDVGVFGSGSRPKIAHLAGEAINNTLAIAEDGVYVATDHAMYRFEMQPDGTPIYTWREEYDRGSGPKPGPIENHGSGTTPTLLGDDLVAIADNADGRINALVYLRRPDVVGSRLLCEVPLFAEGASATETSFVGIGNTILVGNNYGVGGLLDNFYGAPGLTRIDVRADRSGCDIVWTSQETPGTSLPKVALSNGLVYLYTRESMALSSMKAFYLTAIDFHTGATRYKTLVGTGDLFGNALWGTTSIGQDGTVYVGVQNGIVAVRDRR